MARNWATTSAMLLIDIAVIVAAARLMGALFRKIRQPAVVGEIVGGMLLGPTLLGRLSGQLPHELFPDRTRPVLNVIAQFAVILFMFTVGLRVDRNELRGVKGTAATISLCSVVLPFFLGILLAGALYRTHAETDTTDFLPFAIFIGAAMSVTAFPVLARILLERGMHQTMIGALSLACAAVDDILAWSLLAIAVATMRAAGFWGVVQMLLLSLLFVGIMFVVVKPRLRGLVSRYERRGRLAPGILAVVLAGMLLSAFATSEIGIHSIFGAFLFGAIVASGTGSEPFVRSILGRLDRVTAFILPVFFVTSGLSVDLGDLGDNAGRDLALILLVACVGKLGGATVGARVQRLAWRPSLTIGALMNARGLTELVILKVGLENGVLERQLYGLLVIMAVVTTMLTRPLLALLEPGRAGRRSPHRATPAAELETPAL